jgi:hypothetical protein
MVGNVGSLGVIGSFSGTANFIDAVMADSSPGGLGVLEGGAVAIFDFKNGDYRSITDDNEQSVEIWRVRNNAIAITLPPEVQPVQNIVPIAQSSRSGGPSVNCWDHATEHDWGLKQIGEAMGVYGADLELVFTVLGIESHYWRRNDSPLGYKGPFQYGADPWVTSLVYYKKMNKDVSSSSLDRLNVSHQCKVFANDIVRYQNVIKNKLHIEPEPWMIYMLHQQGDAGALHIIDQWQKNPNQLLEQARQNFTASDWVSLDDKRTSSLAQDKFTKQSQIWDYAFEAQGAETTWYYMDWATVQVHHWIDAFKAVYDGTRTGTPWRIRSGVPSNPGWFLRERVTTYIEKDPLLLTFGTINTHELVDAIDELTFPRTVRDPNTEVFTPLGDIPFVQPNVGLVLNQYQDDDGDGDFAYPEVHWADIIFRFFAKEKLVIVMQIVNWQPFDPMVHAFSSRKAAANFLNIGYRGVGSEIINFVVQGAFSAVDNGAGFLDITNLQKIEIYDFCGVGGSEDVIFDRYAHDANLTAENIQYDIPDGYPATYGNIRMAFRRSDESLMIAINGGNTNSKLSPVAIPQGDLENPSRGGYSSGKFIIERIEIYPDNDDPLFLKIVSTPGIIG